MINKKKTEVQDGRLSGMRNSMRCRIGVYRRFIIHLLMVVVALGFTSCHTARKGSSGRGKKKHKTEHVIKAKDVRIGEGTREQRAIVKEALEWLGTPYSYGKSDKGKGADCSGVTMQVYMDVTGKKLPRTSAKQAEYCKKLKEKDVRPGDLVFFATGKSESKVSHVGIMVNDKEFVHASTSKGVVVSNMDQPYWIRTFIKYGRVP